MKIFIKNLYLKFFYYLSSIFQNPNNYEKKIVYEIKRILIKIFLYFQVN